jgi:hypothetical protein
MQNIKNELVDNDNKLNFKDVSFNPPGKENIDHKYCLNTAHDSIIQLNIPHKPKKILVYKET